MAKVTYLAQRAGTGELLGLDGSILPIWQEANDIARFSSRLSCHQRLDKWLKENGGYTDDYDNDPFCIRKVAEDAAPIAMVDPNVDIRALIADISKWHDEYCQRVAAWVVETCGVAAPRYPTPKICLNGERHSGVYKSREHSCTYTLGYAMMYGIESFRETIAHEVVHAYQDHFNGGFGGGHGGDFFGMMKFAAKHPTRNFKHSYDVVQGMRLAKGLVPYYSRAIKKGEFFGLAVEVLTNLDMGDDGIDCR